MRDGPEESTDNIARPHLPLTNGESSGEPSTALLSVLTLAAGGLIANLYYAQPLVAAIGPAVGISRDLAGSIVSMTQVGYGIGLFFIVSLADLVENKRLVLTTLSLTTLGLVGAATASGPRASSPPRWSSACVRRAPRCCCPSWPTSSRRRGAAGSSAR